MNILAILAVLAAGLATAITNTSVGSGSLIAFPTLLAIGASPLVANVTNTVGTFPGSISGVIGQRRELVDQKTRLLQLLAPAALGGVMGATLLLVLPQTVFRRVVPILIVFAVVLVVVQPRVTRRLAGHRAIHGNLWGLRVCVFVVATYAGYFGAGQGVMWISILGLFVGAELKTLNALKNVLAALANTVAAIVFMFWAHVAWEAAALLVVSSIPGGQIGAILARRLPTGLLRAIIVCAGLAAVIKILFF